MYKILVIVTSEVLSMNGAGVSTVMETISFDNLTAAQRAYENLIHKGMSGMTVIALF